MTTDPEHIAISKSRGINIDWKDAHHSTYDLVYLRDHCPCAQCTGAHGTSITVGGVQGGNLGFAAPAVLNNNNATLGALSGTATAGVSCVTSDGRVHVWDPEAARVSDLPPEGASVTSLAVSPDGGLFATGTDGGTVRLWDPSTLRQTSSIRIRRHIRYSATSSSRSAMDAAKESRPAS